MGVFWLAAAAVLGQDLAKHSFNAPHDTVNEFTGSRVVSDWDPGGSATVHRSFIRLTAERQGQKGWLSNRHAFSYPAWSLVMELRASGSAPFLYGDGLAIWFVERFEHIEGPVFGREDYWKGMGIFFDTFQNIDQQHHHKHPYIYAVVNDGNLHYVPDAEKPDTSKQALPGAKENSGCSFDFRYMEERHDVSVLNHTRVHAYYKDGVFKLRVQQTSLGTEGDWFDCFEMKDVVLPSSGFFGISSATGDLVDNHDIIQFAVRNLQGVEDPMQDFAEWKADLEEERTTVLAEFDLRPAESTQRDYSRVLRAQAAAIKSLMNDMDKVKQSMEFQLAAMSTGLSVTRSSMDKRSDEFNEVQRDMETAMQATQELSAARQQVESMAKGLEEVKRVATGQWGFSFWLLFLMLVALAGVGYNRYRKIMKSHLP
jgi:hypothetical protein